MRLLATWIVVAGVVLVAVLAALDSVATGRRPSSAPAPKRADSDERRELTPVARELARHGVRGVLYYADPRCRLRALRLPTLEPAPPVQWHACSLALAPAVAWRERRQLARRPLAPALPEDGGRVSVRAATWLGGSRLAAVVGSAGHLRVAVYERGDLVGSVPWFSSRSLRFYVSPRRRFFALATRRPDRLFLLDRNARPGALASIARAWFGRTSLAGARSIAWSPHERWTALAKNESVYIFTTSDRDPDRFLVRLPVSALDVAWR